MPSPPVEGFYERQLVYLCIFCALSFAVDRYVAKRGTSAVKSSQRRKSNDGLLKASGAGGARDEDRLESAVSGNAATTTLGVLSRKYLVVYAIVMGADWLQGPYVYSLYREQYQFPERLVAVLFVTGFVSAGLAAPLVGVWADQHGRRKLCLAFCITYTLACILILTPSLPILILGRILGGISTSILFSSFESWLISTASSSGISSSSLSTIMGRATLVNGLVATTAGVASNKLVGWTGSFGTPFVASGLLLVLGWVVIRGTWIENYGSGGGREGSGSVGDFLQIKRLGEAWRIVRRDPHLLVLGITQTCFEGSMYLFVFLWVPSLQEVSKQSSATQLPFGYIFSAFMISMMLGSLFYTAIVSWFTTSQAKEASRPIPISTSPSSPSSPLTARPALTSTRDNALTLHAKLSSLVCALSAFGLAMAVRSGEERVRFWAFCLFEACVGMYYPVQGTLRGTLISNEHRATLSSLFRVPLNIFVVVSLLTGVSSARKAVLTASALMLAFSSLLTGVVLVDRADAKHGHGEQNGLPVANANGTASSGRDGEGY